MSGEPVVFRGDREFDAAIDAWIDRVDKGTVTGLRDAQTAVVGETRASFGIGIGPQNQSGALSGAVIGPEPTPKGLHGYEAQVGPSGIEYARKIEIGKTGAHHGPPHPYLQPGLTRALKQIAEAFTNAWGAAGR